MNKKYVGILSVVIIVAVIALGFILKPRSDEKVVNDFLHKWFEKSEDNQNLGLINKWCCNNGRRR